MTHITWSLVVLTLLVGCGRDRKAWAHKIDDLVTRAYACKDVACAKAVDEEMGTIVGGDEGRNLAEGEPELMFSSAERIRNRVADLEADAKLAKQRASSPLTALEVFHTTLGACSLAYRDLRAPVRTAVEASIAKVGAVLPPDHVPKAKAPGGLLWHEAFVETFITAMDGKVPLEDVIYVKVASNLCLMNYLYEARAAKNPEMYGKTMEQLERIMDALAQQALVKDLVAAVRRAAPEEEVFTLTKSTTRAIYASLETAQAKQ
jgi:hypothetical protein